MNNNKISVAIIGGGAAAIVFLRAFTQSLICNQIHSIEICIFEPASQIGVGNAYQQDLPNLLINRPLQTMSADAVALDEFQIWLEQNKEYSLQRIIEADTDSDQRAYISRKIFGYYLQDLLEVSKKIGKSGGIEIKTISHKVSDLDLTPYLSLKLICKKEYYFADYVIFCTGNNSPADIYKIKGTPSYIHNPYPLSEKIAKINPTSRIGIIGNSLTAIDITISLQQSGHQGMIIMLSRNHAVPRIRGKIQGYNLKFLTSEQILNIINKKKYFTLRDALRLFRKELRAFGFHWKPFFLEQSKDKNYFECMQEELKAVEQERKWQSILAATNQVIELCWHHLNLDSKSLFIDRFHRLWLNNRSPIPITNAKQLISMYENNQLKAFHSIKNITYNPNAKNYCAHIEGELPLEFDYVINASGPARYVGEDDGFLYNLLKKRLVKEHPFGGIEVDFQSSSIIDKDNNLNQQIRALGHNTIGVYYYTNSLEMIAKRAKFMIENLINDILKKRLNDKNTMANTANFDSVRDIAATLN